MFFSNLAKRLFSIHPATRCYLGIAPFNHGNTFAKLFFGKRATRVFGWLISKSTNKGGGIFVTRSLSDNRELLVLIVW